GSIAAAALESVRAHRLFRTALPQSRVLRVGTLDRCAATCARERDDRTSAPAQDGRRVGPGRAATATWLSENRTERHYGLSVRWTIRRCRQQRPGCRPSQGQGVRSAAAGRAGPSLIGLLGLRRWPREPGGQ